jgi:hypothetical protein
LVLLHEVVEEIAAAAFIVGNQDFHARRTSKSKNNVTDKRDHTIG